MIKFVITILGILQKVVVSPIVIIAFSFSSRPKRTSKLERIPSPVE